jgi:hypothetical protein
MTNETLMISGTAAGYYVYRKDDGLTIASLANKLARDLFISGAARAKLSVYDIDAQQYICGTVDELMEGHRLQD